MNDNAFNQAGRESGNFALDLSIALISPNEKRRAAAAESASNFCEFSSFLANPADEERLSQLQFDVIMVDIDDDAERGLKIVEKLSREGNNKVLVYSSDKSPEKLARCMRAGARDFLAFPFEPAAVNEALYRLAAPHPATCARREPSEARKFTATRESNWRTYFSESSLARSQARS